MGQLSSKTIGVEVNIAVNVTCVITSPDSMTTLREFKFVGSRSALEHGFGDEWERNTDLYGPLNSFNALISEIAAGRVHRIHRLDIWLGEIKDAKYTFDNSLMENIVAQFYIKKGRVSKDYKASNNTKPMEIDTKIILKVHGGDDSYLVRLNGLIFESKIFKRIHFSEVSERTKIDEERLTAPERGYVQEPLDRVINLLEGCRHPK